MHRFTRTLLAAAAISAAAASLGSSDAQAGLLQGWDFNLSNAGTGIFNPAPSNATDLTQLNFSSGLSVIVQNLSSPFPGGSAFGQTFQELGVIKIGSYTQVGQISDTPFLGGGNLGAANTLYFTYSLNGSVTPGGGIVFSSGTATLRLSSNGNLDPLSGLNQNLATFDVIPGTGGTALISAGGIPSGTIQVLFKEDLLQPHVNNLFTYLGSDLSGIALQLANIQPVLASNPNPNLNSFLSALGGTCSAGANPTGGPGSNQETVCVTEQGQLLLQVPEPSTLALMGAGLLCLGWISRRHSRKQQAA